MHLHEYQSKQILAEYGIPVPEGRAVGSTQEALLLAGESGFSKWVVKAQVHAGGRGKAGGVEVVDSKEELEKVVDTLLGSRLATPQTASAGLPVNTLLIEEAQEIHREMYLGILVDRSIERVVLMACAAGGMDIEEVAAEKPGDILKVVVDPAAGLQPYQCRKIAFGLGLSGKQINKMTSIMLSLYQMFVDKDLSLVEINPLAIVGDDKLIALDAKLDVDDSALYRQSALSQLRDATQEDEKEHIAHQHGLNYISLCGNIACMVNGAGLAMATMDIIKLHGGEPANFLDVGGGTTAERVAEAFKLIVSDSKVKVILVNIFGGIVRCDLIAEGVIQAIRDVGIHIPVVVRLEGTMAEQGLKMLKDSGLSIKAENDLTAAAKEVVHVAREAS